MVAAECQRARPRLEPPGCCLVLGQSVRRGATWINSPGDPLNATIERSAGLCVEQERDFLVLTNGANLVFAHVDHNPRPIARDDHPLARSTGVTPNGKLPRYSVETHSLLTIFVLLAQSNRMAVLTASEIELSKRLGDQLVSLDFRVDHTPARLGVTVRRNWSKSPLQQVFLDFLHPQ